MMILVVLGLIVGMLLGQRFKVLILVPANTLTLVVTAAAGVASGESPWAIVLIALATIASVQMGYLAGTGIRHFSPGSRASHLRPHAGSAPAR